MSQNDRPIRVMRMIARLNVGGPAIHVALLTQKLASKGYDTRLMVGMVGEGEGDMSYYADQLGVEPEVLPDFQRDINLFKDWRTLMTLYREIKAFQPDVVHTHTAKAGFLGRLAARMAGVPVIVHTFHGHVFRGYYSPFMSWVFIMLERISARYTDMIIALSDSQRRELAEEFRIARKSHMTVLPLGLDLERFAKVKRKSGEFREEFDIPLDVPLVGILARLTKVKNYPLFLQAAKIVLKTKPDAKFVLVGGGSLLEGIKQEAQELGIMDSVIFTGWYENTEKVYADLDVKVLTSVNEGTPVTLIESLAAGCPVVSTAVGGVPDLLDGGKLGKLVPSGDAEAVAAAIIDTLDNPPDPKIAQEAVLNGYGIDRLVKDMDGLYKGLLARKRSGS